MRTIESTHQTIVIELLRESLAEKMQKNPSYSARAFARDVKVSPAFISMVLSGKKKLSLSKAKEVSAALEMPERKRDRFLKTVALSTLPQTSSTLSEIEEILFGRSTRNDVFPIDVDQFKFFSNWYNVAILDLTLCSDFQSDVAWIAERLSLQPVIVQDALDRLVRLGLIKKEKGKFKKTNNHVSIPTDSPESTIRNFHSQMIDKAKSNLELQDKENYKRRDISSITMAVDSSKNEEAKKLINDFKNKMADLLTEGHCTDVYQLNVQFFPLTKKTIGSAS